jgi:uncharacterized protein (TIGR02246 family)
VPGLVSKPILDILVGGPGERDAALYIAALAPLGYEYAPNAGVPHHLLFGRGTARTHLVHVARYGSEAWHRALAFRDALRADAALRKAYASLKRELAEQFTSERNRYTAAKGAFIENVLMHTERMRAFAARYTSAWCSQDPSRVASFYAADGSLTINGGTPSIGRAAITAAAQDFMTAFPDMVVTMDDVTADGERGTYHWTLTGTNSGPGGTGKPVRISGYEEWRIGPDGLIAESKGHFDEAEYRRQLEVGAS